MRVRQEVGGCLGLKPAKSGSMIERLPFKRLILRAVQAPQAWDLFRTAMGDGLRSIDLRLKETGPFEPERLSLQEANERLRVFTQQRRRFRA